MMDSEQRARELLAEELFNEGRESTATKISEGQTPSIITGIALRAIRRALEQREAVPVEPISVSDLPAFPTMLRKMWSGGEVQQWINDNIKPLIQERHHDQMCAPPPRDVPEGFVPVPRDALLEVLRISDREHDAWQAVKAAIAAAPSGDAE